MSVFSCIVNFRDNLTKNSSYYVSTLSKLSENKHTEIRIDEHAAFCCRRPAQIVSTICEGYQFTAIFCGSLTRRAALREELAASGYNITGASDAELALTAYIHHGEKCTEHLYGDFTLSVYDCMRRRLFSFNTPSGMPVFYCRTDGGVMISSHPCSFFACPGISAKITADSLCELLSMPLVTSGCIFDGISMLPCTHTLKVSENSVLSEHREKKCPDDSPVGLRETAEEIAAIISEDIPKSENPGIILTGDPAGNALMSIASSKLRQISSYSFSGESTFSQASGSCHSHLPLSESTLRSALEKSVKVCGLPVFSRYDFLLPAYFSRIPNCTDALYFPANSVTGLGKYGCDVLIKNHAFLPAIEKTPGLNGLNTAGGKGFFNYAAMHAAADGIPLKTPLAHRRIGEIMRSVPYMPESIFSEILRQRPGFVPAAQPPCDDLPMLRKILLEIIADEYSPLSAFFDRSILLRMCEGRFDFSGAAAAPSAYLAYLIKLNIWFSEYKPRII